MARSRTALCVVRTWVEESSTVLRAEISLTTDVSGGPRRRVIVTGAENVDRIVHEWLAEVADSPENPE
jgi:hypothetical protein